MCASIFIIIKDDDTKAQGAERRGAGSAKSHHAGSAELGGEAKVGASWRDSGKPWGNHGRTMGKPWDNGDLTKKISDSSWDLELIYDLMGYNDIRFTIWLFKVAVENHHL